jgi:hypothetical protein
VCAPTIHTFPISYIVCIDFRCTWRQHSRHLVVAPDKLALRTSLGGTSATVTAVHLGAAWQKRFLRRSIKDLMRLDASTSGVAGRVTSKGLG